MQPSQQPAGRMGPGAHRRSQVAAGLETPSTKRSSAVPQTPFSPPPFAMLSPFRVPPMPGADVSEDVSGERVTYVVDTLVAAAFNAWSSAAQSTRQLIEADFGADAATRCLDAVVPRMQESLLHNLAKATTAITALAFADPSAEDPAEAAEAGAVVAGPAPAATSSSSSSSSSAAETDSAAHPANMTTAERGAAAVAAARAADAAASARLSASLADAGAVLALRRLARARLAAAQERLAALRRWRADPGVSAALASLSSAAGALPAAAAGAAGDMAALATGLQSLQQHAQTHPGVNADTAQAVRALILAERGAVPAADAPGALTVTRPPVVAAAAATPAAATPAPPTAGANSSNNNAGGGPALDFLTVGF